MGCGDVQHVARRGQGRVVHIGRRDFRNDYWLYPRFDGDQLTMNFVDLTQWQAGDDPACFVRAGATVEMTNTFERVA